MKGSNKRHRRSVLGLVIIFIFALSLMPGSGFVDLGARDVIDSPITELSNDFEAPDQLSLPDEMTQAAVAQLVDDKVLPEDFELHDLLTDTSMDYRKTWEPWISKAATHAIAATEDGKWMAVGTGYLHDNEIHIYRWNPEDRQYDKVWVSGDGIISGDVVSLSFGDTDNNNFLEIIAGATGFGGTGGGGHVYVFEQRHIFDPFTNTENQFELVWKSPNLGPVFAVKVDDVDKDYHPDIIVGSWDRKIRNYEYTHRSGYPFSEEHWIEYEEVFQYELPEKITSIETADTNYNALPEIIVGTYDGTVYILENDGEVLWIGLEPFPLINDNNYKLIWDSGNATWNRVTEIRRGNLDADKADELVLLAMNQGVYTLDYDKTYKQYYMNKLTIPLEPWETPKNIFGEDLGFPLDHWADWMIDDNETGAETWSVYNYTGGLTVPEPFPIVQTGYDSSLAQKHDGFYTWFFPNVTEGANSNASAVIDFGKDEEITSDGRFGDPTSQRGYEVAIKFGGAGGPGSNPNATWEFPEINKITFNISRDLKNWATIPKSDIIRNGSLGSETFLLIDLDGILGREKWDYVRYLRMTVWRNGTYTSYKVDSLHSTTLYRTLDFASSVAIGPLDFDYDLIMNGGQEDDKVIVGTVDGKLLAYSYDPVAGEVDLIWNSFSEDLWTMGRNIWAIQPMQGEGKIPTWMFMNETWEMINVTTDIPGEEFASMSYTHLSATLFEAAWGMVDPIYQDMFELNIPYHDLVIGTQRGNIRYFPGLTNYHRAPAFETAFFGLANAYYSNLEPFPYTSVAPAFANLVENPLEYPETMFVGYMSNDPTKAYDPAYPDGIATAGIHAWAGFPMFQYQYDLAEKELSGMLSRALETSQKVPRPYFADVDGDGDQDMIFTNGRIYYLENILNALWRLQPDYFADLNFNTRGYLFDGPQLYDFDADGDLDLAVGIRSTNKNGTTYYENKGTRTEPIWEEDKWLFANSDEEGNLAFNYHTDVLLKVDPETNLILNLTTYKSNGTAIGNFMADYKYHNSFILGTNPLLTRVEINLKAGETPALGEIRNYGYHVFETWDTEDELKEWTFSLSVGDLDDDGNKEVVVGSYDSNAYVFEHLTNNTYKRAYRSPDLTHQVTLAQSPYGSEQLEGLSGEFKRTFWDHVDVILAGMDLDGDGLQEFVAAADLSLFVFEATRTLGGYIQQDTYELIWQIDLRQSEWAPLMAFLGVTEVTALASGHDLNFNDRGEFVVAAGGFLFIFESWNDNDFREIFLTNTNPLLGRYGLPGNPLGSVLFSYTNIGYLLTFLRREINALAVGDTDGDKYPEILIGGTNNTLWGDEYGFLEVIESRVGSFELEWEAPLELTKLNPVLDIRLDDQDYDGHQDIIVGHVRGVDVWEYNGSQYVKQAIIPGSIKHPYYDMNPVLPIVLKLPITPRSHDVIQLTEDINSTYQKGDMIEAYGGFGRLWWSISKDNGATWTFKGQLIPDYIYPGSAVAETEPSLYFDSTTKNLWVIYRSLYLSSGGGTLEGIGYTRFGPGTSWSQFRILDWEDESTDNYDYHSPSVWAKPDSTYAGLGISYVHEDKTTTPSNFTVRLLNLTSGGFPFGVGGYIKTLRYIGLPGNTTLDSSNGTHSILTQDMVGLANGDYLLAFAGRQYDEYKLDTDIWAMQINAALDERRPTRVNAVGTEDLHPSVAQISNPGTNDYAGAVFLAFESIGDSPGNMLYGTYSRDNGLSWRAKEALPILPTFAAYATDYATGISVLVHKDFPFIWIRNYRVFAPAVAASSSAEGGYVFAFQAEYEFAPLGYLTGFITEAAIQGFYGSLLSQGGGAASYASMDTTTGQTAGVSTAPAHSYPPSTPGRTVGKNYDRGYWKNIFVGTNPDSIFTRYDHWEAEAISAGDSDGDGFREVAIASRYQAYDVELRNSLAPRTYVQQFQSPELGTFVVSENKTIRHRVTDIELYDSNGNGYAEIIVSTEGGNVYAFEIINTEAGQVDLQYFKDIRRDLSYSNTSVTLPLAILGAGNFTGDEYDDIVFSSLAKDNFQVFDEQLIFARDGRDGSILWNYSTSERKAVQNLVIDDFDGNGIDDLLFSANSTVFGLRGDTGTELWSPITGPVRVTSIGLFDAGGSPAFAFARDNNVSAHFIADGSLYWENSAPNGTIYMISSANLSNSSAGDDLVFVDITGDLWILNNTGQTQWINQTGFGIAAVSSSSVGLKDRVLFINSSHTMLLDSNGSIVSLLNRTHEASYASTTAEVLDLNGDGIEDVLIADGKYVSPVNIQAFDGMTGVLLWQYLQPEDDWPNPRVVGLTHMTIGFLAEDRPQIVVGTGYGAWFLDGRDGKPDGMFRTTTKFNSTNPYVVMGVSGNFGPLGTAALLLRNGTLIVVGPITHPTTYSLPLGIQTEAMWDPYRVPGAVSEIVIGDIDNDGIADDFVSGTSKKALVAFHGDTGDVLWKLRAKGPIRTMAAGDLDKDGHTDVVYGTTDGQLGAVLGASGVHLWTSYLVGMNIFDVEIVDHDDDGSLDVIVGAGSTITLTQGYVLIYPGFGNGSVDLPTKIDTIFTPVTKLFVGDFSNNGVANDIAALAILSGIYYIEKGVLFHKILDWVLSAVTGAFDPSEPDTDIAYLGLWNRTVLYSVKTGLINDWTVPYRLMLFGMASGDVDGDAVDEVFVRSMGHATYAYAVNTTGTPLWTFEEQAIFTTLYPALVDMNQDGTMDLLMKNYDTLFAIDGLTGTPVWAAFVTSDGIGGYAIGDLDTDGIPDIALGTSRGRVMVVEGIKNPNLNVGPIKPLHIENRLFADLAQFIEDNAHGYSLPLALLLLITVPVIVSFAIARHRRGALYRFGGAFA